MFDLGWSELLIIAVVAIVVVGPKDLPRALRAVGKWTGKMKRTARDFQRQFNDAIREAELDSVKKDVEAIGRIDPIGDVRNELAKAGDDINKAVDKAPADAPAGTRTAMLPDAGAKPLADAPATGGVATAAGEAKP